MAIDPALAAFLRKMEQRISGLEGGGGGYGMGRMTYKDELDCIPGRRVAYDLIGSQDFTTSNDGQRGQAITFLVSTDGPFILTHRPLATWKVTTPTNATNFGFWRPVFSWPLPEQEIDSDFIDTSFFMTDTGPGRQVSNEDVPGNAFTSSKWEELPVPTRFEPNTTISIIPTYENIAFSSGGTATTGGRLYIVLRGYKIITSLGNG